MCTPPRFFSQPVLRPMADASPIKTSPKAKKWSPSSFGGEKRHSRLAERCLQAVKDNRASLLARIRGDRSAALEALSDLVDDVNAHMHDGNASAGEGASGAREHVHDVASCACEAGHEDDEGAEGLSPDERLELLLQLEHTLYEGASFEEEADLAEAAIEAAAAAAAAEEAYLQELVAHFEQGE